MEVCVVFLAIMLACTVHSFIVFPQNEKAPVSVEVLEVSYACLSPLPWHCCNACLPSNFYYARILHRRLQRHMTSCQRNELDGLLLTTLQLLNRLREFDTDRCGFTLKTVLLNLSYTDILNQK